MQIEFKQHGLALVPGPDSISQPYSSTAMCEMNELDVKVIANTLLSIDGIKLKESNPSSWWDWEASYQNETSNITFKMACMGDDDSIWGGFFLDGYSDIRSFVWLWQQLRKKGHESIWMHDNTCEIYTPQGFLQRFSKQQQNKQR